MRTLASTGLATSIASVLLAGSHARGRAIVPVPMDRPARAASDFDLYIVTRERVARRRLEAFLDELGGQAARNRERFRVDLHLLSLAELRRVPPVIRYVDLRAHGKVLAGEDVRGEMPALSAADLPAYEGLRRMLNAVFFFFERAAAGAPVSDLVSYLYGEAASAFAIAVGAHGQEPSAVVQAVEHSRFSGPLESRIPSYAARLSSGLSVRWGRRKQDAEPAADDWETALRDYVAMIDIYAECTWGCRPCEGNQPDGDAAALRLIARDALAPYVRWSLRQRVGVDLASDGTLLRLAGGLYQVLTNVPVFLRARNRGWPAASDLTVHHGLKIYWSGRRLLEEVAAAGPGFASEPETSQDVERFMRRFEAHFLRDSRSRTVLEFGTDSDAAKGFAHRPAADSEP